MHGRFRKMTDVWIHETVRKFTSPSPVLKTSPSCVSALPMSMLSALLWVGSMVSVCFSSAMMDRNVDEAVQRTIFDTMVMKDDQLGCRMYIYTVVSGQCRCSS